MEALSQKIPFGSLLPNKSIEPNQVFLVKALDSIFKP